MAAVTSLVALAFKLAVTPTVGTSFDRSKVPIWGLPEMASDVDFVMRPYMPISAYSFTTDEPSFVAWSENYLGLAGVRTGNVSIQAIDPISGKLALVRSENGVEYRWTEEDRGQYAMFDRNGQRAYYFSHTR